MSNFKMTKWSHDNKLFDFDVWPRNGQKKKEIKRNDIKVIWNWDYVKNENSEWVLRFDFDNKLSLKTQWLFSERVIFSKIEGSIEKILMIFYKILNSTQRMSFKIN